MTFLRLEKNRRKTVAAASADPATAADTSSARVGFASALTSALRESREATPEDHRRLQHQQANASAPGLVAQAKLK